MFSVNDSSLLSGNGQIGAWESANDSSHAATEDVARECSNVRPDRAVVKAPFSTTRCQYLGGIDFVLDETDAASSRASDAESKVESGRTGKERDIVSGR